MGSSILQREDGATIQKLVSSLCEQIRVSPGRDPEWKIYNILHRVRTNTFENLCDAMRMLLYMNTTKNRLPVKWELSIWDIQLASIH